MENGKLAFGDQSHFCICHLPFSIFHLSLARSFKHSFRPSISGLNSALHSLTTKEILMRKLYLGLAVVGAILPLRYFIRFLMQNGLDMPLLLRQLFQNDISSA